MVQVCTATLESVTPYSQSYQHDTEKLNKETHEAYEKRTWRNKAHTTDDGLIFIPPMAFKQALDSAAKYLSLQVPGKGKATYTKHFLSGLLVMDKLVTSTNIADVAGEWINCNSDGVRGSGKRVKRCFPTVNKWSGSIDFYILDDLIDREIFEKVLREAGGLIGIGRFRPQNGGFYGRFKVNKTTWREE